MTIMLPPPSRSYRSDLLLAFILFAGAYFTYSSYVNFFNAGWNFDDERVFSSLSGISDSRKALDFITDPKEISQIGRPVALASFLLNITDWPTNPGGFRRINALIHVINGLLLALVVLRVAREIPGLCKHAAGFAMSVYSLGAGSLPSLYMVSRHSADDNISTTFRSSVPRLSPWPRSLALTPVPRTVLDDIQPTDPWYTCPPFKGNGGSHTTPHGRAGTNHLEPYPPIIFALFDCGVFSSLGFQLFFFSLSRFTTSWFRHKEAIFFVHSLSVSVFFPNRSFCSITSVRFFSLTSRRWALFKMIHREFSGLAYLPFQPLHFGSSSQLWRYPSAGKCHFFPLRCCFSSWPTYWNPHFLGLSYTLSIAITSPALASSPRYLQLHG